MYGRETILQKKKKKDDARPFEVLTRGSKKFRMDRLSTWNGSKNKSITLVRVQQSQSNFKMTKITQIYKQSKTKIQVHQN
jgi:hypothetical protein